MTALVQQISDNMADLVEAASLSVLRVDARQRMPATGIAWSENLIVTAHHVVEVEDDITVALADGSQISARLLGRDPHNDLAVLQVNATLNSADWAANDSLRVGNLIMALGRPGEKVKATWGIVSGVVQPADMQRRGARIPAMRAGQGRGRRQRRAMQLDGHRGGGWGRALADGFVQTDVIMYPGFSGGPLLGADGKVHGLNTSGFMRGASMAVPVATIRKSVAALLADGSIQQGYLGIGVQEARLPDSVAEALDQDTGLLIVSVEDESPAAEAGMLVGDILTGLDGELVAHVDDLQLMLTSLEIGSTVKVEFVRGGVLADGSVKVGAK